MMTLRRIYDMRSLYVLFLAALLCARTAPAAVPEHSVAGAEQTPAHHPGKPDLRIAAARRAEGGQLLRIFPSYFGTAACRIGYGGPKGGVMPGTCTTRLGRLTKGPNFSGQSVIVFTERWQWPPPGTAGTHRAFSHTWLVRLGPTLKIFGVEQRGAAAPQLWA